MDYRGKLFKYLSVHVVNFEYTENISNKEIKEFYDHFLPKAVELLHLRYWAFRTKFVIKNMVFFMSFLHFFTILKTLKFQSSQKLQAAIFEIYHVFNLKHFKAVCCDIVLTCLVKKTKQSKYIKYDFPFIFILRCLWCFLHYIFLL